MVIDSNLIEGFTVGLGFGVLLGLLLACWVFYKGCVHGYVKGAEDTMTDKIEKGGG